MFTLSSLFGDLSCAAPRRPAALIDCGDEEELSVRPPHSPSTGNGARMRRLSPQARARALRLSGGVARGGLTRHARRRAQSLTKAALTVYKGSALESSVGSVRSEHEDMELVGLLAAQIRRGPRAESCQMIVNVAQLLARTPRREAAIRSSSCAPSMGSGAAATTSAELRASKNEQAEPLRKSFELPARTSADPDPEEPRAARFV